MKTSTSITLLTVLCVALIAGCRHSTETATETAAKTAAVVAKAYGIGGFSDIDTIRFTFNIKIGDRQIQRKWSWRPEIDSVLFEGKLPSGNYATYAYLRRNLKQNGAGISERVDRWFINDQYWLLFPLHLAWDRDLQITLAEGQPLPIQPGSASRLTVTYPKGVGYTPGDTYELYLDENNRIRQWVYRMGGAPEPARAATWENHVKAGPLVLSLEHNSADGNIRLWFSDVAVKLKGDESWITPEPLK